MSSSRDNRRENRDLIKSLADKDEQVRALQERILKMEEEIASKDVTTTNLRFRVELLLKKNLQYCTGEFMEANDEVRYLDVCASVIGKKVQLVREWLLINGISYLDTEWPANSSSGADSGDPNGRRFRFLFWSDQQGE